MAKASPAARPSGLTRGKAILIGALAVALVGVLYIQFGGAGGEEQFETVPAETARRPASRAVRTAAVKPADTPASDMETQVALVPFDQARWKSPDVTKVIAYDPFALPAAFPQPHQLGGAADGGEGAAGVDEGERLADALERLRSELDDLQKRGVQVIINQEDQYIAMIGDRMIHVGDEINGFTVTQIDPNGVRVELKETQ